MINLNDEIKASFAAFSGQPLVTLVLATLGLDEAKHPVLMELLASAHAAGFAAGSMTTLLKIVEKKKEG